MKKSNLWALTAAFMCGLMTFSACSKDDDKDNPVKETVFMSHFFAIQLNPTTGDTLMTTMSENTWEGGLLRKYHEEALVKKVGVKSQLDATLTYSGNNCTEIKIIGALSGPTIKKITYDANGRITGATETSEGMELAVNIKSYTDDGHIKEIEYASNFILGNNSKRSYDLTWKDGNIVKYTIHFIEPAEEDVTVEVDYDNYPSIYTGFPAAYYVLESPDVICRRASKNNPIEKGKEYKYQNGRLVSNTFGTGSTHYVYTDGTGQ